MRCHALFDLATRHLRARGVEDLVDRFEGAAAFADRVDQLAVAHLNYDVAEYVTKETAERRDDLD